MAWRCVVGRVIVEMLYGKPCCLTARMQLGDQFFRIGLYGIAHIDICLLYTSDAADEL